MTQENKDLLLQDLCARLPYGVNIKTKGDNESYTLLSINSNKNIALIGLNFDGVYATSKLKIDEVKPYLRPLSSMTEEEFDKYEELEWAGDFENLSIPLLDWLNKKMFDYRGLIPKDLAIAVTEENNPYRKNNN